MPYTGSREQQDQLREALRNDLTAPPGSKRAGAAIVRSLNQYLRHINRAKDVIIDIPNKDTYLRKFANGRSWKDETTKSLLWDLYVSEGRIIDHTPHGLHAVHSVHSFAHVFQRKELRLQPIEPIISSFLIYKRTISDPDRLVSAAFYASRRTLNIHFR